MLCSSLFRRREWISAARALTRAPLQLKERRLEGHDVALPICGDTDLFKIKLFVSGDAARTAETTQHVERLVLLDGGTRAGIILLLDDKDANARMVSLSNFQILLFSTHPDLPIFPITSPNELLPILQSIQSNYPQQPRMRNSNSNLPPQPRPQPLPPHHRAHELIPHLVNGPPLGETNAHMLSDLFGSLAHLCGVVVLGRGGQAAVDRLVDHIGEQDARRVMEFFTAERAIG